MFFCLSCVSGWEEKVAIIARWSEPRSSSTQKSWKVSIILGVAKIRSSFPAMSFVYAGSLSLIFVYLSCSVYCTSSLPSHFRSFRVCSWSLLVWLFCYGVCRWCWWFREMGFFGDNRWKRLVWIRLACGWVWHGEDWLWVLWLLLLVVVLWLGRIATPLPGFGDGYEIL